MDPGWRILRIPGIIGALVAISVAIAACGSGSSSSSSSSSSSASAESASASSYNVAKVSQILSAATAPAKWEGPTERDPAVPNKHIVAIPTFAAAEGLQIFDEGVNAAAKVLGWQIKLIDAKGTPAGASTAISQAITEKADGVVLGAIAPSQIPNQLKQLKAAGIPVVDYGTVEPPTEGLWVANIGLKVPQEAEQIAASIAKESNGKANLMLVQDKEYGDGNLRTEYFRKDIKELCSGCKISNETDMVVTEIETKLGPKIGAVLQANPGINMIYSPFDAAVPPMIQAIKQAGLDKQVKIVSRGGFKQSTEYLRKKEIQVATIGEATQWIGWEALDTLNRHYRKLTINDQVTKNDPLKLLTWENAPPPGKFFEGEEANYKQHYTELWKGK
jgi:ribose transport system substrate-binding protein